MLSAIQILAEISIQFLLLPGHACIRIVADSFKWFLMRLQLEVFKNTHVHWLKQGDHEPCISFMDFEGSGMRVEVFIKNEEVPVRKIQVKSVCRHCHAIEAFKTEKIMNEDSKRALEEARKKAENLNAEIVIYDLATFKGKLAARLKGVKSPTWKIAE